MNCEHEWQNNYSECGGLTSVSYDDTTCVHCGKEIRDYIDQLQRENAELQTLITIEQEEHAKLQAKCYEGFPSVSDGVFDCVDQLQRENAELRTKLSAAGAALGQIKTICQEEASWNADANAVGYKIWCVAQDSLAKMRKGEVG